MAGFPRQNYMNLDPTLSKIRKFNSENSWLLSEDVQSMENFEKEVKAFYAEQGTNVPDKVIKLIITIFGTESAKNPELAKIAKNIFKNPNRFIVNVEKALGLNAKQIANKIDTIANPTHNPEITKSLDSMVALMQSVEQHVSGSHSVLDTISADQFDLIKLFTSTFNRILSTAENGNVANLEMLKLTLGELRRIGLANLSKNSPSEFDDQDLSNETLKFFEGPRIVAGTVLLDSDSPLLSQDTIEAINQGKNPPLIGRSLDEIKKMPHYVWIQVDGKVHEVKKATIPKVNLIGKLAEFLPQEMDQLKSLLELPRVFFHPISNNPKENVARQRRIGSSVGGFDYEANKIGNLMGQYGVNPNVSSDKNEEGKWYSPLKAGVETTPALLVLNWVMENVPNSGIDISNGEIVIEGGQLTSGRFINKYVTINFSQNTRGYDASTITSMDIKNINVESLINFCRSKKINALSQKEQVLVRNNFLR